MSDSDFDKIAPADITLNAARNDGAAQQQASPMLGVAETQALAQYQQQRNRILWGMFGVLLLLAVGVVFVLPEFITPPQPPAATQVANPGPAAAGGGRAPSTAISPFQEAQRMRQREEAQNILGELLELQQTLERRGVKEWAAADYDLAFQDARTGDSAYREQNFEEASRLYQSGLDRLLALESSIPQRFDDYMARGAEAFDAGDASAAESAYSIAILLRPESDAAITGLDRSQVLLDVLNLLEEGSALHRANQFEAARDLYRQAREIDGDHPAVRDALSRVNNDILERDFSGLMSQGYAALQAGNPEGSRDFFNRAQALKPSSQEVQDALKQAADTIATTAINKHLAEAGQHESAERWQAALDAYNAALEVDPNVVRVVEGRNRSNSRLQLDNFLEFTINNPLRLAEAEVFQQTQRVYNDALRIADAGPRLQNQLRQVGAYLDKALQPVPVTIRSNGQTDITLLRIGALGKFTDHTLSLTPGVYTAVGVRPGYRDVRQEFTVAFDEDAKVVTVQSDEAVR